jgi:hypothetical protein
MLPDAAPFAIRDMKLFEIEFHWNKISVFILFRILFCEFDGQENSSHPAGRCIPASGRNCCKGSPVSGAVLAAHPEIERVGCHPPGSRAV